MYTGVCGSSEVQEGAGSVRFVSVPILSRINGFGSVRFGKNLLPVGCGSVLRPVLAGSGIKRFRSVRFSRFGSVSHSFLPVGFLGLRRLRKRPTDVCNRS